jgi:anti-sigma factor RsiW
MHSQQHPDPELMDRLRAGLLDDQADEKKTLQDHIEHCPSCQSRYDSWQQLGPAALGPRLDAESLSRSLQQARQQALENAATRHSRTFTPYATAALLLIAVSIGFWVAQPEQQDTQLATAEPGQDVPDLYEDIDFYLWLAGQNGNSIDNEDSNPNNT